MSVAGSITAVSRWIDAARPTCAAAEVWERAVNRWIMAAGKWGNAADRPVAACTQWAASAGKVPAPAPDSAAPRRAGTYGVGLSACTAGRKLFFEKRKKIGGMTLYVIAALLRSLAL